MEMGAHKRPRTGAIRVTVRASGSRAECKGINMGDHPYVMAKSIVKPIAAKIM